jgi:hypothetical protein
MIPFIMGIQKTWKSVFYYIIKEELDLLKQEDLGKYIISKSLKLSLKPTEESYFLSLLMDIIFLEHRKLLDK